MNSRKDSAEPVSLRLPAPLFVVVCFVVVVVAAAVVVVVVIAGAADTLR